MRVVDIHHRNVPATGGQTNVIALGCFREGAIDKVVVLQTGGVSAAFSYDLYSRQEAAESLGSGSLSDNPGTPADEGMATASLYKVNTTAVSATAGSPGTFEPPASVKYRNADAGSGMTRAKGRIYLVLTSEGSGPQSFDVRIIGLTPQNV